MKRWVVGFFLLLLGVSFSATSSDIVDLYTEKIKIMPDRNSYEIAKEYNLLKNEKLITIVKDSIVFVIEQDAEQNVEVLGAMVFITPEGNAEKLIVDIGIISLFLTTLSGDSSSEKDVFKGIMNQIEVSSETGLDTAFFVGKIMYKIKVSTGLISISAKNV